MPRVLPNCPTEGSQLLPLFRVTWLQPMRKSLTRLELIIRVQSPTVL